MRTAPSPGEGVARAEPEIRRLEIRVGPGAGATSEEAVRALIIGSEKAPARSAADPGGGAVRPGACGSGGAPALRGGKKEVSICGGG